MKQTSSRNTIRDAFSFLELQVALVLLGIALAGLVPLVVMQSKQLKKLEARLDHTATYYLVPSTSTWARKLGAPAAIETEASGGGAPPPGAEEAYEVAILSLNKSLTSETVEARVLLTLTEVPEEE